MIPYLQEHIGILKRIAHPRRRLLAQRFELVEVHLFELRGLLLLLLAIRCRRLLLVLDENTLEHFGDHLIEHGRGRVHEDLIFGASYAQANA